MIHWKSSGLTVSRKAPSATPALLNTRLTLPWSRAAWSAQATISSRLATLTLAVVTFTPSLAAMAAVSARPFSLTSLKAR